MRLLNSIVLLAATIGLSSAAGEQQEVPFDVSGIKPFVTGRYFFEFGGSSAKSDSEKVLDFLKDKFADAALSIPQLFDHDLMRAATIQFDKPVANKKNKENDLLFSPNLSVNNEKNANKIDLDEIIKSVADLGLVTNVYPVRIVPRPSTSAVVATANDNIDKLFPHAQTQVDRVHKELKNTGKGISVGIIDSGKF